MGRKNSVTSFRVQVFARWAKTTPSFFFLVMADIFFLPETRSFMARVPFTDQLGPLQVHLFFDYDRVQEVVGGLEVYFTLEQAPSVEAILLEHQYHLRPSFNCSYQEICNNPAATTIPFRETDGTEEANPVDPYEVAKTNAAEGISQCITGEGGSGKSFLAWQIYAQANRNSKTVAMTAMTGTAAVALKKNLPPALAETLSEPPNVMTCHSFFGLSKKSDTELVAEGKDPLAFHLQNILHSPTALLHWQTTDIVIIDEVSMMPEELFNLIQLLNAKRELRAGQPLQFVLVGDFYQLPPVEKGARTPRFCFQSCYWEHVIGVHVVNLTKNYRILPEQHHWRQLLHRLRLGQGTLMDKEELQSMSSTIRAMTPAHLHLYGLRVQVDAENQRRNALLKAQGAVNRTYVAEVTKFVVNTVSGGDRNILHEYKQLDLARKLVTSMCRDEDHQDMAQLELFVGSRVMIDTNNHELHLVNGMRGTVTALLPDRVDVLFDDAGARTVALQLFNESHTAPRHGIVRGDIFTCTLKRLPLRLAFAMTIHKAQATTLDKVYINFAQEIRGGAAGKMTAGVFEKGQVYVALSRCRDSRNLIVDGINLVWGHLLEPLPKVVAFYQKHASTPSNKTKDKVTNAWLTKESVPQFRPPGMIMYLRQREADRLEQLVRQQQLDADEQRQQRLLQQMLQDQRIPTHDLNLF